MATNRSTSIDTTIKSSEDAKEKIRQLFEKVEVTVHPSILLFLKSNKVSKVLEESSQFHESQKELLTVVRQLEEQLEEYKHREDALKAKAENRKTEVRNLPSKQD